MKKIVVLLVLSFFLTGCSAISVSLYGKVIQNRIESFEVKYNQYSITSYQSATVNKAGRQSTIFEEGFMEVQQEPYFIRYDRKAAFEVITEVDGVLKTYTYAKNPNSDGIYLLRELETSSTQLSSTLKIDFKNVIVREKNPDKYELRGTIRNFLNETEVEDIYVTLEEILPKIRKDKIETVMNLTFDEFGITLELEFDVMYADEDEEVKVNYYLKNEIHSTEIEMIDLSDRNLFFPLLKADEVALIDGYKPIYYRDIQASYGTYEVFLEKGYHRIFQSSVPYFDVSLFEIWDLNDRQVPYTITYEEHNYEPLSTIFYIENPGIYQLKNFGISGNDDYKIDIKLLSDELFSLTSPNITVTNSGDYRFRFNNPLQVMIIQLNTPLGSIINISGDYHVKLSYPNEFDIFHSVNLDHQSVTLTQHQKDMYVYLTMDASTIVSGQLKITVSPPLSD